MAYLPAKRILVFSETKVLVAVFKSMATANWITGVRLATISEACKTLKFTNNLYWRVQSDRIHIDMDDIGKLKLGEYNKIICYRPIK